MVLLRFCASLDFNGYEAARAETAWFEQSAAEDAEQDALFVDDVPGDGHTPPVGSTSPRKRTHHKLAAREGGQGRSRPAAR